MKFKFLAAVASALIISLSSLYAVIPSVYADEESEEQSIIVNDNFDDGDAGNWVMFGGGNIEVTDTTAHSGTKSIKALNRKQTYQGPSITCDSLLTAGETYNISGWVYYEGDTNTTMSLTAKFVDSAGEVSYSQVKGAEVQPDEWTELSNSSFVIPETAVEYTFYFECSDAEAEFFVDDITIKGKKSDSAKVSLSKSDYISEYIYDFESDVQSWNPRGSVNIVHTDEYSNTGSHSIYVTNRNATWNGPSLSVTDKIRKEKSYHYSVNVMYNGSEYDDSHGMRLEIQYTINGSDSYNLIAEKKVRKGRWTTIEGYYTVPEEAKNISVYVQTDNVEEDVELTESDLMSFYVDTVKITEGAIVKKAKAVRTAVIAVISAIVAVILILIGLKSVKRIRKNRTALKLVSIDAMTQVFNRNSYEKKIEELENDTEQCKLLYYALCDVNFLKYINDNFGHKSGDEAITRCAKMLSDAVGSDCKVYRTGGDEFVCISKVPVSDRIRSAVKTESANDKGYPFAVACGFAEYDEKECADIKSIIAKCDKEMYADKQRIKSENQEFSRK